VCHLSRSIKVIGTETDRSATYDFLIVIHSNYRPISYRFQDKRQFRSKFANFPARAFNDNAEGVPNSKPSALALSVEL